ncbi:MAG: N-acetylmuramoyl-L-alanine amidase [Eubacteriales bacterium]
MEELCLIKKIPFFTDILPPGAKIRPGLIPDAKKYIVIHNTGNYNPQCGARWHNGYIHGLAAEDDPRKVSWHFTVDGNEIWQHLPIMESAWHAGDGNYGRGNYLGVGIEICVNGFPGLYRGEEYENWEKTFLIAIDNAAMLAASLMKALSLGVNALLQHYDCAPNKKNCPMQMRYDKNTDLFSRENGSLYNYFLHKTEEYLQR